MDLEEVGIAPCIRVAVVADNDPDQGWEVVLVGNPHTHDHGQEVGVPEDIL
jgi:hypothetical protein